MKPKVRIVIPAYNESRTILRIVGQVLSQTQKAYALEKVIVYSDGSTDGTADAVRSNFPQVTVKDYRRNRGKNVRVNQMMSDNTADILIQIDADIELAHSSVIDEIVKPFSADKMLGISCSYHTARPPVKMTERIAHFGFVVWDTARESLGDEGIRYYCEGGMRAFSAKFARRFRLPEDKHVGEDSYSYYWAVTHGFHVAVNKSAAVYFSLAGNVQDYTRQMRRFLTDPGMVDEYFEPSVVAKHETLRRDVKMKALIRSFVKNPVYGVLYVVLQGFIKLTMPFYSPDEKWKPVERSAI